MHPNAELISTFYKAFARKDAPGMIACYHPEIRFSDPVFPDLQGERAGAMWRMLCERGADLQIEASNISADDQRGAAHWDARYTFSQTGRKVLNRIDATFEFRDGKIIRHRDEFDLWKWAGMALGVPGRLLGWLPPFQGKIRANAGKTLERFVAKGQGGR
jgi:ketosteroid isomerase-like protein